jgi:hypothetical protein
MAFITFPSIKAPSSINFGLKASAQAFTSEFTGSSQYVRLPGSRWYGSVNWENLDGEDLEQLKAFLAQVEGPYNTFSFGDVSRDVPRSGLAASVIIEKTSGTAPAHSTSFSVQRSTAGSAISGTVSAFKTGDYFSVTTSKGTELKIVTADIDNMTNTSSRTLSFAPALRGTVSAGQDLTRIAPRALMRLTDNEQAMWDIRAPILGSVGFAFQEAF